MQWIKKTKPKSDSYSKQQKNINSSVFSGASLSVLPIVHTAVFVNSLKNELALLSYLPSILKFSDNMMLDGRYADETCN